MKNLEVARILRQIAVLLDMKAVPFKPRAYEKAADSIAALPQAIEDVYSAAGLRALEKIPGVGKSMAGKLEEFLLTGGIELHRELSAAVPVDLDGLLAIDGLGPKGIHALYEHLG